MNSKAQKNLPSLKKSGRDPHKLQNLTELVTTIPRELTAIEKEEVDILENIFLKWWLEDD